MHDDHYAMLEAASGRLLRHHLEQIVRCQNTKQFVCLIPCHQNWFAIPLFQDTEDTIDVFGLSARLRINEL